MESRPRTDRIRHSTHETNHITTTLRGEVSDKTLKILMPLVRHAIDTGDRTAIPPTRFWLEASEESRCLMAAMGTEDGALAHMTVRPPKVDGAPAAVEVNISGLIVAIRERRLLAGKSLEEVSLSLGDMERCVAWAWLVGSGFA